MTCTAVDFATIAGARENAAALASTLDEATDRKRRAFEIEALPHLHTLYRVALGFAGDPVRAEDLVQDTMLRAYRSWHQYRPGTNIRAWLLTILRNAFLRDYRKSRRMESVDVDEIERLSLLDEIQETDPEGRYFRELVDAEVIHAIARLPVEFREVLLLSDLEGLAQMEIAHVTGVPVGTVKSRLHRARRLLQRRLYRYAVEMGYLQPAASAAERSGTATR